MALERYCQMAGNKVILLHLFKGDDAHIILKKAIDEKEQEEFRDFLKDRFA
jgi:hypothetical protein